MGECSDNDCDGGVVSTDSGEAPLNFGMTSVDIGIIVSTSVTSSVAGMTSVAVVEVAVAVATVVVVVVVNDEITSVLFEPGAKGRNVGELCSPQCLLSGASKNDFITLLF